MRSAALLLLCCAIDSAAAAQHAVLVATSRSYANYRHQADVCHAYQLMTKGGVPAENIVVMAWDDVASSRQNPFKGKLFNHPTKKGTPGVDVYAGCKIDYKGNDVTADNFLKILKGNSSAMGGAGSGRVLQSGPNDDVFINFVDHGGVGEVCFGLGGPSTKCGKLKAATLVDALKGMHTRKQYKQLVFYLEACESGSMFKNLPTDIGVFAVTAANAKESSFGTYCQGKEAQVDGKNMRTCLGDLFSVNWMEDADAHDLSKRTLSAQYHTVKTLTLHGEDGGSHVEMFGDRSIDKNDASLFEGKGDDGQNVSEKSADGAKPINVRDIPLRTAFETYLDGTGSAEDLIWHIRAKETADTNFRAFAEAVVGNKRADGILHGEYDDKYVESSCRDAVDAAIETHCGGYDEYALRYSRVPINLCSATGGDPVRIIDAVRNTCAAK